MTKKSSKRNIVERTKPVKSGSIDGYDKYKVGNMEYVVISSEKGHKSTIELEKYMRLPNYERIEAEKGKKKNKGK